MEAIEREAVRARVDQLVREAVDADRPLDWFERLYALADGDPSWVPWADGGPNPHLVEWLDSQPTPPAGQRALVIGCGLGDDAAELAGRGYDVTAFDLSETAIVWARERFADAGVTFDVADLLALPAAYRGAFDLVAEVYTLQAMPRSLLLRAQPAVAMCTAPGGKAVVICRGRDDDEPAGDAVPHPLSRSDLNSFVRAGMTETGFDDFLDHDGGPGDPPIRRFRVVYERPAD